MQRMQRMSEKTVKDKTWLGIMPDIEIWPYKEMAYTQPRICPGKLSGILRYKQIT